MGVSKVFMARTWLFFGAALFALVASMLSARAVFAQPPNVGEEPAAGPIVYNLIPSEGAVVPQDQLSRAGARPAWRGRRSLSMVGDGLAR